MEIRPVYEVQKMVDFDRIKSYSMMFWLFKWSTWTTVFSVKLCFSNFPFCYGLVRLVHFNKFLGRIAVGINTQNLDFTSLVGAFL